MKFLKEMITRRGSDAGAPCDREEAGTGHRGQTAAEARLYSPVRDTSDWAALESAAQAARGASGAGAMDGPGTAWSDAGQEASDDWDDDWEDEEELALLDAAAAEAPPEPSDPVRGPLPGPASGPVPGPLPGPAPRAEAAGRQTGRPAAMTMAGLERSAAGSAAASAPAAAPAQAGTFGSGAASAAQARRASPAIWELDGDDTPPAPPPAVPNAMPSAQQTVPRSAQIAARPPEPGAAGMAAATAGAETGPAARAGEMPAPAAGRSARRAGRVKTRLLGFQPAAAAAAPDIFEEAAPAPPAGEARFPVGWVIVLCGPGRGASFALQAGVAQIGRGEDQAIRLDFGDTAISRQNHAAIAYDDERREFFLGFGGKSNLVRLNDAPVLGTEPLEDGDLIRIGETTLRFIALCGPDFAWDDTAGDEDDPAEEDAARAATAGIPDIRAEGEPHDAAIA